MYLRRKIDAFLEEWKASNDRKPLIIKGPRQILSDGYSEENILRNISILSPEAALIPHETLLVFDEIQEFPDIATSLKFFKLKGNYDVILSGSMLGLNYRRIESNSVGYKEDFEMTSMDFEEFLWAKGYGESLTTDMLSHMQSLTPFSQLEMDQYDTLFLDYCLLGGMPEVVKTYIEQRHFSQFSPNSASCFWTMRKTSASTSRVWSRRRSSLSSAASQLSSPRKTRNSKSQKSLVVRASRATWTPSSG